MKALSILVVLISLSTVCSASEIIIKQASLEAKLDLLPVIAHVGAISGTTDVGVSFGVDLLLVKKGDKLAPTLGYIVTYVDIPVVAVCAGVRWQLDKCIALKSSCRFLNGGAYSLFVGVGIKVN